MPTDAELRALVEKLRRIATNVDYTAGYRQCATDMVLELESLLRPQEPEHAARERLIESARHLAKQYESEGNGVGVAAAEDRLIADVKALDAAERNRT